VRRRPWIVVGVVVFGLLLAAGLVLAARLNPAKSFSVPRVDIDATLHPDGTLQVVEHITYDFTGSFRYGTRPIPVGAYQITDVTVSEDGRALTSVGAPYNLQWFFDATDEERTFDITYVVRGATLVAPDVVELYWKWVGEDHPTIGRVDVHLAVPPGPGEVRAWGHGPLNGVVRVEDEAVRWTARAVPQGTFVEGRVAMPTARFPTLPVTALGPRLPTIIREETAWARAANAERREAAESEQRQRDARDALQWVAPLAALVGLLVFLGLWSKFGREPPAPPDVGEYVRDLPDDPPAVVEALMHWGSVRPNAFGATVLDLAQRGHLTITETKEDRGILPDKVEYTFARREPAPAEKLKRFETATLGQLFAAGPTVTQSALVKFSRAHQSEATSRWNGFRTSVEQSVRGRGYLRGARALPFFLNVLVSILVAGTGVAALAMEAWVGGAIALTWGVVQLALTPLLRQRTPAGQRRYHEWLGVRNFLRDFSQLADAPSGHLALWERYLVYAVALGVSDQLARGLAARLPAEQAATFATWYVHSGGGDHAYGSIGQFSNGFATTAVGSFTPPSSGGGGGGGFSGGGGGGGGGGGIGAG
jgi:uncharacterized membrane protein